jgi:hypothetical protein
MANYIFLMHSDVVSDRQGGWDAYLEKLKRCDAFEGGSEIGQGVCMRKSGVAPPITEQLVGYIRLRADSLEEAKSLLAGNPHFEAGGTVEIRELPRS